MLPAGSTDHALAGVTVIDISGTVATAYCAKLFADHGARVINLEPPEGFSTRALPPHCPGVSAPESSALHAYLHSNKLSVTARLSTAEGRAVLEPMARGAQVLLCAPGVPDDAPGVEELRRIAPRALVCSLSWFGTEGPYAGYAGSDAIVHSLAGMVRGVGLPEGPPLLPSGVQAQIIGGLTACIGVLGQLLARGLGNRSGGLHLDTSIHEANLCFTEVGAVAGYQQDVQVSRMGVNRFPPTYPLGIFPCRDGWLGVTALTPSQWHSFCGLLGMEEFAAVPDYQTALGRLADAPRLDAIIRARLETESATELFNRGQRARVPLALVPTMEQLFGVDQFLARGAFAPLHHPEFTVTAPVTPFRLLSTPAIGGGRVARLGEHDVSVMVEPGADMAPAGAGVAPAAAGDDAVPDTVPRPGGLLQGVRVIDLSMGWAGPLAARHLADMGAEVIKVESCERFDWWRGWEATPEWIANDLGEKAPAFNTVNRNKLDVTLDLTDPAGKRLLKRLVAMADVVVENYSGGVLEKLGLDYPVLSGVNPDVVMISMPAFGRDGPWRHYRAYGSTVEQASGLPHLNGQPDWPPTMQHVAYGDAVGGLNGAAALLTALVYRARTGRGQYLDLSQAECLFPLAAHGILTQAVSGEPYQRLGNRSPQHAPHGVYPCRGDDEWITIQVRSEAEWRALTELAGPELASFGARDARLAHRAALDEWLASWTGEREGRALMAQLQAAGVPAGYVESATRLSVDPHLASRGYFQLMERAYVGVAPNPLPAYRENGIAWTLRSPAPTLGQHNHQVLGGLLGLTATELTQLAADGIIGDRARLPARP